MRTTVSLDPDVFVAIRQFRASTGVGLSDAINQLIRRAIIDSGAERKPFVQATADVGLRVDVTNVADVLESLDAPT